MENFSNFRQKHPLSTHIARGVLALSITSQCYAHDVTEIITRVDDSGFSSTRIVGTGEEGCGLKTTHPDGSIELNKKYAPIKQLGITTIESTGEEDCGIDSGEIKKNQYGNTASSWESYSPRLIEHTHDDNATTPEQTSAAMSVIIKYLLEE